MIEDEDDDRDFGTKRGISGPAKKKKGASTALIDAVSILASAKSDEEERKYTFLGEHLQQQVELRQKELDLERERLEIEREKNRMEERRTKLMMRQMEATFRLGANSKKESEERCKNNPIIIDSREQKNEDFSSFSDI